MIIKKYVKRWYGILMHDVDIDNLEQFLIDNINEVKDVEDLRNLIRNYIIENYEQSRHSLKYSIFIGVLKADNSDLEQMLELIKGKAGKRKEII